MLRTKEQFMCLRLALIWQTIDSQLNIKESQCVLIHGLLVFPATVPILAPVCLWEKQPVPALLLCQGFSISPALSKNRELFQYTMCQFSRSLFRYWSSSIHEINDQFLYYQHCHSSSIFPAMSTTSYKAHSSSFTGCIFSIDHRLFIEKKITVPMSSLPKCQYQSR